MNVIPSCPDPVPDDLDGPLRQLAEKWANSTHRPRPDAGVAAAWDQLIESWINDKSLPLIIRKVQGNRGTEIKHAATGRVLVPADNSPAHWVFAEALAGVCPSADEISGRLGTRDVPVAMILSAAERQTATFLKTQSQSLLNKGGWNVCHIESIGLRKGGEIASMPITRLEQHFRLFLSPMNMFVVPLKLRGFGELPQMLAAMRRIVRG